MTRLLFAFLLLWGTGAFACPGDSGEPLPPAGELKALEQALASAAPQCEGHPGYLAYRGAVLNALGRPAEAALLLERALLLDPLRAGAQIDYAEALAALGDAASAVALLRQVLARPDVPAHLRLHLQRRIEAMQALGRIDGPARPAGAGSGAGAGWHGAGSLTLKAGWDSNLNSAPAHDTLTLTTPAGDAVLALAERFRPRAGGAALVEADGRLMRPLAAGAALQVFGEARLRTSPSASGDDFRQLQLGSAWTEPLGSGSALFAAAASHLAYGGVDLYRAVRISAARDWRADGCRPSVGLDAEWRRYPAAPELAGRFLGLSAGLACNLGANRLAARLRAGHDAALASRPGGDQRQTEAQLNWSRPLGSGRLGADLLWYRQQDAEGYSPLLERGADRRLDRVGFSLEYAWPVAPGWSVVATVQTLLQRSNLALFDLTGHATYLGLRWSR